MAPHNSDLLTFDGPTHCLREKFTPYALYLEEEMLCCNVCVPLLQPLCIGRL